ncbi:Hypothetical protein PHPALM_10741 [Phytophthora palmivora]|uniref:Uncharacterized protein n=1 Tax=Phytophthora palmivora TaxID=4796 RepID=A0A2P4Y3Z4_9STRA|nr:Hypothetical protein PHPALM_10741 [Phytophthora palmivora]
MLSPAPDDDEDYAELALEPAAVDRLMGGQCLVEQLSTVQQPRKRRRASTIDQDVQDPAQEPLCCLSDVEDTNDDADDGADALIAAFGDSDQNQNQTQDQTALRKTLPHTSSASAIRVCRCGKVSRGSLLEDVRHETFDPHSASREYLDLHIRYAVVVRVVRVETVDGHAMFVLKVSDAETQKRWEIKKTLKEMMQFYSQIQSISLVDAPDH